MVIKVADTCAWRVTTRAAVCAAFEVLTGFVAVVANPVAVLLFAVLELSERVSKALVSDAPDSVATT